MYVTLITATEPYSNTQNTRDYAPHIKGGGAKNNIYIFKQNL